MNLDKFCAEHLNLKKSENSLRFLRPISANQGLHLKIDNTNYINFSSNDYLGLRNDAAVLASAKNFLDTYGAGSGASRLVSGNSEAFSLLENKIARFKKTESALVFSSGYATNLGIIQSLTNKNDLIIGDKLNHASIIDGCRLSEAAFRTYPHLDLDSLEKLLKEKRSKYTNVLIITDSVFSMDGDIADLKSLCEIKEKYDCWLMVDEAHSTGVFGENGRGLVDSLQLNSRVDIIMGTLSKALGSQGGFVAGSKNLIEYLVNNARSFIYSTGLTPAACGAALKSLEMIESDLTRLKKLNDNRQYFESITGLKSPTPIYPIILGDSEKALSAATKIREAGFYVLAIRPPTVPIGTSRLRITISAGHSKTEIESFANLIKKYI